MRIVIHEGSNDAAGKWKIENNKLVISGTDYMDYPNGFDITTLTSTDLQLYYHGQHQMSTLEQKLF